ncbi:6605_t:CDS:2 [Racocetra fulgida]|uniref:6605_t:CDS:1 n=1 Tax=Racocetra fulgida TaxID=60492 RepID=A0A9N9CZG8_9GLOM|nr:6605_t:CDS:2 [Racocetra fulgida]
MVDLLIVTIAPVFIGANGILAIDKNSTDSQIEEEINDTFPKLVNVKYEQFGRDIVLASYALP